jgi:hypothetical protein
LAHLIDRQPLQAILPPAERTSDRAFSQWLTATDDALLDLERWLISNGRDPSGPYPFRPVRPTWRRPLRRCG